MSHRHAFPTLAVLALLAALAVAGCAKASRDSADAGHSPPALAAPSGGVATARTGDDAAPSGSRRSIPPSEYRAVAALADVHFDFDRAEVRTQDLPVLDRNAGWMLENPKLAVLIVGHTDERGTPEYNLALGDRRAKWTMSYLVSKGVPARRFEVLSYGEERPVCREHTDACWARNRRAQFLVRAE